MIFIRWAHLAAIILTATLVVSHSQLAKAARPNCDSQFVSVSKRPSKFENFYAEMNETDGGHRIVFFEHLAAKKGKPTLVLLNGLFVPRTDLQGFREKFEEQSKGEGLVIAYYSTQMESLSARKGLGEDAEANLRGEVLPENFAREVAQVIDVANITGPITLMGYSYGSFPLTMLLELRRQGEFKIPNLREVIFLAGLVEPSDSLPMGSLIPGMRRAYEGIVAMNPWLGPDSVKRTRENSARGSATSIVSTNLMAGFELPEGVSRETMIKGLTNQILAAYDFDLRSHGKQAREAGDNTPVHFMIAENELFGQSSAQRAAANSWGVEPEVVPGVPHHMLAYNPEVVVPILLKRLRAASESRL